MVNSSRRGGRNSAGGGDAASSGRKGDVGRKKGEAGAGKGSGGLKGHGAPKGSGKGKKGEASRGVLDTHRMQPQESQGLVKTVQELEAEMLHSKLAVNGTRERREVVKQPLEADGTFVKVKKHSDMGCAVVTFADQLTRDRVMQMAEMTAQPTEKDGESRPTLTVNGVSVQLRAHLDKSKDVDQEVKTDIFIAWGRQAEKLNPLSASAIAEVIDNLVVENRSTLDGVIPQLPPASAVATPTISLQSAMALGAHSNIPVYPPHLYASPAQAAGAGSPVLETTPPRTGSFKMRADANEFQLTPPPLPFGYPTSNLYPDYYNQDQESSDFYNQEVLQASTMPPRKRFEIVDPKSGTAIEAPQLTVPGFEPQVRKPVKIMDPSSGQEIDTLGMIFTRPEAGKKDKFLIVDPSNGAPIQV